MSVPRSMKSVAITLGMLSIPSRLYKAQDDGDAAVAFRLLCPCHDQPIKLARHCTTTGEQVNWSDVKRGFEVTKNEFVIFTDDELDALPLDSTQAIELSQFVIPPGRSAFGLYSRGAYFLEPDKVAVKAFHLLKLGLERTGKWGIGKVAFRDREHLCVIQPHGPGLLLNLIAWPQDIRSQSELHLPAVAVSDQEVAMVISFIDQLTDTFAPEAFQDEYRAAFDQLVEAKLGHTVHAVQHPAPMPTVGTDDVFAQLKASVEAAKAKRAA